MKKNKKITVIGLGYIGLPTAAILANNGYDVAGVDVNQNAVDIINKGEVHIVEPDLDAFVRSSVSLGRLRAYDAPKEANIYMICVPTPFHKGGVIPRPNINFILSATRSIAPSLKMAI